jgi:hypothetical protein
MLPHPVELTINVVALQTEQSARAENANIIINPRQQMSLLPATSIILFIRDLLSRTFRFDFLGQHHHSPEASSGKEGRYPIPVSGSTGR